MENDVNGTKIMAWVLSVKQMLGKEGDSRIQATKQEKRGE